MIDTDLCKLLAVARRVGDKTWSDKDSDSLLNSIDSWPWYEDSRRELAHGLVTGEGNKEDLDCLRDMAGVL